MQCPRRSELFTGDTASIFKLPEEDRFINHHCSWCGSLDPEVFMQRLEEGTIKLTPTDKDYKVYVENDGGLYFMGGMAGGTSKFYFQHLTKDQRIRFLTLLNEKKIKLRDPGFFYVLPFFAVRVT